MISCYFIYVLVAYKRICQKTLIRCSSRALNDLGLKARKKTVLDSNAKTKVLS